MASVYSVVEGVETGMITDTSEKLYGQAERYRGNAGPIVASHAPRRYCLGTLETRSLQNAGHRIEQYRHGRSHSGAFFDHDAQGRLGRAAVRRWALSSRRLAESGFRAEPPRSAQRPSAGRRPKFWLRLLARTRALGAARFWDSRRHQYGNRRHLSRQFLEEWAVADHGGRSHLRMAARQSRRRGRHRSRAHPFDAADRRVRLLPPGGIRAALSIAPYRGARLSTPPVDR